MHIFYSPEIAQGHPFLNEEESRHAVKVLRLEAKDYIIVVDGKGSYYEAEIAKADAKKCELRILKEQKEYHRHDHFIHIAIAPTKNSDRMEWFTEKAVEIGVDKISFIRTSRSERKNINIERIEKIAISAMKQSLKAYLPEIGDLIPFEKFLTSVNEEQKFIAHLEEDRKELFGLSMKNKKYCILIGPEGDFSPDEINLAKENGFLAVSLGTSRLRTETAGMVACHILNLVNSNL
jgi:16S rRNA (uracil1498-N3)-methyltransferase